MTAVDTIIRNRMILMPSSIPNLVVYMTSHDGILEIVSSTPEIVRIIIEAQPRSNSPLGSPLEA